MKTLTIKLTAPMQAYGGNVSFNYRTTNLHPSKSAIIGMIGAALGYRRNDPRILQLNDLLFAVRVDQPGKVLRDFQTVHWKKNGAPKITYRDYLQDTVFMVAIGSENEQFIDEIEFALHHPKFQLQLGRRSCPPAGPLQTKEYPQQDPVATLKQLKWQATERVQKRRRKDALINLELFADATLMPDKSATMVKDKVISFDQRHRQFDFRPESSHYVKIKNPQFQPDANATDHDIMGFL